MVGVPGRSHGCNTCRQRRVKCDETKPVCLRCTRAGFECSGYVRERIWRHTSTLVFSEPTASDQAGGSSTIATPPARRPSGRLPPPAPGLSLIAFQGDFCTSFMFANFVWRGYGGQWLGQAAQGKLGSLALDSTRALSQANFGRSNDKPDIERKGILQYGTCLQALTSDGLGVQNDVKKLVVPILLLIMHAGSYSDQAGAVCHLRGLVGVLQICGPEAFQGQPMLDAFEASRAPLLVASLISKQRLFLDEEKWRTIPWALNPGAKTPQSEVLDILVMVPGMLQEHLSLSSSSDSGPIMYNELVGTIKIELLALYRWRWRWQARSGKEVSSDASDESTANTAAEGSGSIGKPPQHSRLFFSRFTAAMELMLYDATLMWLLALLWKISPLGAVKHIEECAAAAVPLDDNEARLASFEPLYRPGGAIAVRGPAMEICRAFEWVASNHSRGTEPTFLYLFPIGMAMGVLESEPETLAWVKSLLNKSPVTSNYSQSSNSAGFGFYLTRESLDPETSKTNERLFVGDTTEGELNNA